MIVEQPRLKEAHVQITSGWGNFTVPLPALVRSESKLVGAFRGEGALVISNRATGLLQWSVAHIE